MYSKNFLVGCISLDPVRIKATFADYFSVLAVLFIAVTGTYMTLIYNLTVVAFEYWTTIGPMVSEFGFPST